MEVQPIAVRPPVAAQMIGVSRSRLYEYLQQGEVDSFKADGIRLVPVESLHAWMERRRQEAASTATR